MASTKIRGITIELNADTSGISKGLKTVNSEIKSTQSQLKDVDRLLKLDPTNTQLLEQKQRLLKDAVGQTATKLDTLKKAQEEVGKTLKETGEGQEQYDALTREIVNCENELKKAEKAADSFNVAGQKISATADKMAAGLSSAADKTRGMSMVAGGALTALGAAAYKTAQSADELSTLAQQSGFTTEELQKMKYAAELIDVPMETITGAAAKMTKQLASSEGKFEDLGVATRNADGSFRSVNDIFFDTVQALSEIPNETERDIKSMEIFGKSANDLAGIIDDGGAKLHALGEEAQNLGVIIPEDQIEAANQLNDEIEKLKSEGMGAFAALGTEVVEMVLPYIPKVAEAIEKVIKFIKTLDPGVLKLAVSVLAVTAAISPMLTALAGVASGISAVSSAITFLLANPLVLLIAAITALVVLIATKGDEIQGILKNLDDFLQNVFAKDFTQIFGPVFGEYLNAFVANIRNMWNAVQQILNGLIDFIRGVFTGDWERAWYGVQQIFEGIFDGLVAIAKAPLNGIIGLLNSAISGINSLIEDFNSIDFELPDWLGGGSWSPSIPTIGHIPYLAKGGILSQGSAIVGEAGAELLTMAGGRAIVQPLTNNTTNYAGATNNFYIQSNDPEQVAEEVASILNNQVQRLQNSWA